MYFRKSGYIIGSRPLAFVLVPIMIVVVFAVLLLTSCTPASSGQQRPTAASPTAETPSATNTPIETPTAPPAQTATSTPYATPTRIEELLTPDVTPLGGCCAELLYEACTTVDRLRIRDANGIVRSYIPKTGECDYVSVYFEVDLLTGAPNLDGGWCAIMPDRTQWVACQYLMRVE